MSFNILPPLPLKPLTRLTPTNFQFLHLCTLKKIWSASNQTRLLPLSPVAYLGIVIHKMFELANKGKIKDEESINNNWNKEIKDIEENIQKNNIEKHLVPLANSAKNYEVKRIMAFIVIRSLIQNNPQLALTHGRNGRDYVAKHFERKNIAYDLEKSFNEVLLLKK